MAIVACSRTWWISCHALSTPQLEVKILQSDIVYRLLDNFTLFVKVRRGNVFSSKQNTAALDHLPHVADRAGDSRAAP